MARSPAEGTRVRQTATAVLALTLIGLGVYTLWHFLSALVWAGLRPVSPAGTPLIGETEIRGLWVNSGHGHLGWTLSCGSGRVAADLINGKNPGIPLPPSQGVVKRAA